MKVFSLAVILAFGVFSSLAQEKPAAQASPMCPAHYQQKPSSQDQHHEGVEQRGDEVMGFSHEKTTHHFRLYADGGAIEAARQRRRAVRRDGKRPHRPAVAAQLCVRDRHAGEQ